MAAELEHLEYDVVIVGAGGAGLRAAIAAREAGLRTAIICKSLFGKAHTVMAEGGIAASMGNVNSKDSWQVHFRDTMRGGKFLNSWRMAELHAKEAPDRVWELETYGALFDRTPDGRISQRNFGGHEYPRLAHVGDRTGLELIRTLQQKIVSLQQDDERESGDPESRLKVFAEVTITDLLQDPSGAIAGAFGYWRESGRFVRFNAPAVVLATGGIGKSFKVTSNSWEYTGDGHALALRAGSTLVNMEFIQFHPTGHGVAALGQGHPRHRVGARRRRRPEELRGQALHVRLRARRLPAASTPRPRRRATGWYTDPDNNKRPPELLPRDEVARAINSEVKAGRGSPHGGVFLDIASRRTPEEILKKLPSMHHQFKELADVDITKEAMEVGPTCHYVMGGVEVDPDSAAAAGCPASSPPERCPAACTGPTASAATPSRTCSSSAPAPGRGAAAYVLVTGRPSAGRRPGGRRRRRSAALAPFEEEGGENPYTLHQEMQQTMNDLVGIIRTAAEIERALERLEDLKARAAAPDRRGPPAVQPGLAPRPRPAQHARRQRVRGAGRAAAPGEPRWPHPRRLPDDGPALAGPQPHLLGGRRRHRGARAADAGHARRPAGPLRRERAGQVPHAGRAGRRAGTGDAHRRERVMSYDARFRVWRGDADGGELVDYTVEVNEGEVVLDIIHRIQATQSGDLAVRWNCKAGKCGSCSAEVNGMPRLLCMTRMSTFTETEAVTVTPMRAFPVIRDLVTDVSFNYAKARQIPAFAPPERLAPGDYRMQQVDVERSQEFRKCIECFLCQDTCHVVRDHEKNKEAFAGPRFLIRAAELDMHPLDAREDRADFARDEQGIGMCNITKCCTEVCPEHIKITDNAIIPMKERVVGRHYDPLVWLGTKIGLRKR